MKRTSSEALAGTFVAEKTVKRAQDVEDEIAKERHGSVAPYMLNLRQLCLNVTYMCRMGVWIISSASPAASRVE